jgi:hypothetical protein
LQGHSPTQINAEIESFLNADVVGSPLLTVRRPGQIKTEFFSIARNDFFF